MSKKVEIIWSERDDTEEAERERERERDREREREKNIEKEI